MLGLSLNHVSKRGYMSPTAMAPYRINQVTWANQPRLYVAAVNLNTNNLFWQQKEDKKPHIFLHLVQCSVSPPPQMRVCWMEMKMHVASFVRVVITKADWLWILPGFLSTIEQWLGVEKPPSVADWEEISSYPITHFKLCSPAEHKEIGEIHINYAIQ